MTIWIEIVKEKHDLRKDGRQGWAYGKALWSPTANKAGSKIYELMKEPIKGEMVLHFLETSGVRYYHAYSKIKKSYEVSYEIPDNPGNWGWAKEFYKIVVTDFTKIENSINISGFTEDYDISLRHEIHQDSPQNYPFQIKRNKDPKWKVDSQVTLKQGKYLTVCSNQLFTLLQECSEIENSDSSERDSKKITFDGEIKKRKLSISQEEFSEGIRKQKETSFFARNTTLVKEAKRLHGYKCQACEFVFGDKYGEFGKDYIECHHENVLSERPKNEWNKGVTTSINQVKVLCSNCHRMIHHKRPAISFDKLIKILSNDK